MYSYIDFKKTQADTEIIISSKNKGLEKLMTKNDLDRIELTIQSYNYYKNH